MGPLAFGFQGIAKPSGLTETYTPWNRNTNCVSFISKAKGTQGYISVVKGAPHFMSTNHVSGSTPSVCGQATTLQWFRFTTNWPDTVNQRAFLYLLNGISTSTMQHAEQDGNKRITSLEYHFSGDRLPGSISCITTHDVPRKIAQCGAHENYSHFATYFLIVMFVSVQQHHGSSWRGAMPDRVGAALPPSLDQRPHAVPSRVSGFYHFTRVILAIFPILESNR
ncbi:hypothetical protein B0T13DRAFT_217940 [Neurospora crassa]|nr:hypothetical protein B0T13DRAFT_217940 [Neurospora crassa]